MIWLWRIYFSCLLLAPVQGATVTGQVELLDSRDPSVRKQKNYAGVVVWLERIDQPASQPPARTYTMEQKGKKFLPHILAIPVGSTVHFPNFDPIFHNAFSNFSGQPFDTGLYAPGTSQKIRFRREGIVRVFCNIHSTMSAVIVVVATPYFAVTARSGAFSLEDVPPGEYRLRIWHERAPESSLKPLERNLSVGGADETLPPVRISESGYLEVPHTNKFGKQYPPDPGDSILYPGARK